VRVRIVFSGMDHDPGYELVALKSGARSIRSLAVGETFHPVIGPMAEADALYVRQLGLAERMQSEGGEFVIWDVGLGGGANVLTVLDRTRGIGQRVRVVSFDRTLAPLSFALRHAPELGYFSSYQDAVSTLLADGKVTIVEGHREIHWEVVLGDFPARLADGGAAALPVPNAILYDAYSPLRNPVMWTLPLFEHLFRCLVPDRPCALATYSRSTMLRVTLLLAGFHVGVGRSTGEKEETTIAGNRPELLADPLDDSWLKRARASTSAEPMREPVYRQLPLADSSYQRLLRHPQFRQRAR